MRQKHRTLIFKAKPAAIALSIASITLLSGCPKDIAGLTDPVQNVVGSIDRAIEAVDSNSANWLDALRESRKSLEDSGQSMLANEIDKAIAAAEGRAGVEFRCGTDFLLSRTKQTLTKIKDSITNKKTYQPIGPTICQWEQGFVDLKLEASRRNRLQFYGYDLKQVSPVDNAGIKLSLHYTSDSNIANEDYTSDLSLTTNYTGIIDLAAHGVPVQRPNTEKLVLTWDGEQLGEARILHPIPPTTREISLQGGKKYEYRPPHTKGDRELGHSILTLHNKAELEIDSNNPRDLYIRIFMSAIESGNDASAVEGTSPKSLQYRIYRAPEGYVVKEILSPSPAYDELHRVDGKKEESQTHYEAKVDDIFGFANAMAHTQNQPERRELKTDTYRLTNYGLVSRWYQLDRQPKHEEAGTFTKVEVTLRDIKIKIEGNDPQ